MRKSTLYWLLAVCCLSACDGDHTPAIQTPPPAEVGVITIAPATVALAMELPGRLEATRVAEVRARVPGILLRRVYREGSDVRAGEVLFRIDPAPLQAVADAASAALQNAQATLVDAEAKLQRYTVLLKADAVSHQDYDDALAARQAAVANVASATAALRSARLNLSYATVVAPIAGRAGRALVTEGALVGQSEVTPLTTIEQIDPIYVDITESSADLLRLRRALEAGRLHAPATAAVTLTTEDGQRYAMPGKLLFGEQSVDPATGSVFMRAEFPNPHAELLPGMYVRAQVQQAQRSAAIRVPLQAVMRTIDGAQVYVVGADSKVSARPVTTGSMQGQFWIIETGLRSGERVIVDGIQKAKPGAKVKCVPWQDPLTSKEQG